VRRVVRDGQVQDSYVSRLHVVGVTTLFVVTAALVATGWSLRPSSGGLTAVPTDLELSVAQASPAFAFTEVMASSGGGATLALSGQLQFTDAPPTGPWLVGVQSLGAGHLCTPRVLTSNDYGRPVKLAPQHVVLHPHVAHLSNLGLPGRRVIGIAGNGVFYVRLCWDSGGPVAANGAYLSARFPILYVDVPGENTGSTRQLNVGSQDAADYAIQSVDHPTSVTQGGWQWSSKSALSFSDPLAFAAVNTTETQHDSYQAFLSGIVFGVAGGALVALIQELVAPFRTRRELRSPEPGG
jgi:hypothetical protein